MANCAALIRPLLSRLKFVMPGLVLDKPGHDESDSSDSQDDMTFAPMTARAIPSLSELPFPPADVRPISTA